MDASADVSFDGWTLRRSTGELLRGDRCTRLPMQSARALEELLSRPGELVTRRALIAKIWPRGVVDYDTALNTVVHRLRVALGDHAEHPKYIQTIPRRGYRFIGRLEPSRPVASDDAPEAHAPPPPIETLSAGLAAGRTRAGTTAAKAAMAATLASLLVAGGAYATLQQRTEPPGDPVVVATQHRTANPHVVRARFLMQRREPGDVRRARHSFLEAIADDDGVAEAWAGLASTHWLDFTEGRSTGSAEIPQVIAAARRALALDPNQTEARMRLHHALCRQGDRREAEQHLRLAQARDPLHPLVLAMSINALLESGRLTEAVELAQRMVATEPLAVAPRQNLFALLLISNRLDEAASENERIRELNPGGDAYQQNRVDVLLLRGNFAEALATARTLTDASARSFYVAVAAHALGRDDEADASLRALIESAGRNSVMVAEVLAQRGDRAAALESLQASSDPTISPIWVRYSPYLRSLHAEPGWQAWIRSGKRVDAG